MTIFLMIYSIREVKSVEKRTEIKKNSLNKICMFFALFCFYFILQLKFVNDMWFGTDELDIMVLGKAIARGRLLYVDIFSQHMPISYYISALFYKLGAVSVTDQRVAFYLFFALMWTSIVFVYNKVVDYKVLILYPLIHCCLIQNYDLGTTILSEHLAGCGAIVLALEFFAFVKTRLLTKRSYFMISYGIILTFGTIFISVYALFFLAVGVVLLELKWGKNEINKKQWIRIMLKRYIGLGGAIAVPWIILMMYYFCTHSFSEFIYGAYTINRTVYPKYNGGTGNNILSMFFVPIEMVASFITNGFNINSWSYVTILQWIVIICGFVFLFLVASQYGKIESIILFLFIYALGIRGIFNFHGTACVEMLAFATAYVIVYLYKKSVDIDNKRIIQIGNLLLCILIFSGYANNISKFSTLNFRDEDSEQSSIIEQITEKDESIWMLTFDNADMMMADRVPIGGAVTTPWTWQDFGKKEFSKIKEISPRVAIFDENHEVWGNELKKYAPRAVKYIKNNYVQIPGTTSLYVRKDYYNEAMKKIEK